MVDLNEIREIATKNTVDKLDADGYIVGKIAKRVIEKEIERAMIASVSNPEFRELQEQIEQTLMDKNLLMG